jgi:16S rRNA (cytosine967-C5)-methyltransferase
MVRWWRQLWYLIDMEPDFSDDSLKKLMAAYLAHFKGISSTAGITLEFPDTNAMSARLLTAPPAIGLSLPDWLHEYGTAQLGDRWIPEMAASNTKASVFIRVNSFRFTVAQVVEVLSQAGFVLEPFTSYPDTFKVTGKGSLVTLPLYNQGAFEIQDAGSQQIVPFMQIEPGMRIIDACAGTGGKTLHIHVYTQDKGRIVALDTDKTKLENLRARVRRVRASNVDTVVLSSADDIRSRAGTADRLLLDVPCSGSGVFKRNPDARWKLTRAFIDQLVFRQALLLQEYSIMVKPGGKLVYATCSLFPSENGEQIDAFLSAHREFILEEERQIWPSEGADGFYMARLYRHW